MTDFLAWLLAIEVVGLAFLPLAIWLLRRLPDRGYIFAKILGLLLTTYVVWLAGSLLPVARSPLLPWMVILAIGAASWWRWRAGTLSELRRIVRLVAVEESLFVAALVVCSLLRVHTFGSAINHTEQFQDLSFLSASLHSASFPPYDPWMSGHTINYYYFGYLMFATLTKLSGVAPSVGYNLALSLIFAFTVGAAYSVGYALSRRLTWALLAPIFVALLGNWHAALWWLPHQGCAGMTAPDFWGWLFGATRVVGGHYTLSDWSCAQAALPHANYTTITEFPLFSFVLGDLHPHVMALPVSLLAIALGGSIVFDPERFGPGRSAASLGRLVLVGICVGALFTINSWDFPTYLLLVGACIGVNGYLTDATRDWWKVPSQACVALGVVSLALYAPFYLHFRSLAHGIGPVTSPSDPFEVAQAIGFCLLASALLVGTLGALLRPVPDEVEEAPADEVAAGDPRAGGVHANAERGSSTWSIALAIAGLVVVGAIVHQWVLLFLLLLGGWAVTALLRVLNTDSPRQSDAIALICIAGATLVLAFTETGYLRDAFDGTPDYRMNTVFKFYYQAWVLLSLGGAYAAYRTWSVFREFFAPRYAWAAMALIAAGALAGGVYTRYVPAYAVDSSPTHTLDGMAWVRLAHPGDYAAIRWLQSHVSGTPVVLEATQDDFSYRARISSFTGLPTVMGWPGHEDQWRPGNPDVGVRVSDVRTIYTTENETVASGLLRKYGVTYVVVGDQERADYSRSPSALQKFARFMHVAFRSGRTVVYRVY